jgi:hypothetical protein
MKKKRVTLYNFAGQELESFGSVREFAEWLLNVGNVSSYTESQLEDGDQIMVEETDEDVEEDDC